MVRTRSNCTRYSKGNLNKIDYVFLYYYSFLTRETRFGLLIVSIRCSKHRRRSAWCGASDFTFLEISRWRL